LLACQSIESNVCGDQVSFFMRNVRRSSSCICDVSWVFMSLVALITLIDSGASSMPQRAQLGLAAIGPIACARMTSTCWSALMFSLSYLASGWSMRSACHFTQWKLNAIPLHHRTIRSCIVMMRSQSHFILWKVLSVIWYSSCGYC
jgi:hypothetical protein